MIPEMEDALNPRIVGATEGMTLQVMAQIRDVMSQMNRDIRGMKESTDDVRDRVIRLEERNRRLDDVELSCKVLDGKVDMLLADKERREGVGSALGWLLKWGPTLFGLFTVLFLIMRATGTLHIPVAAELQKD